VQYEEYSVDYLWPIIRDITSLRSLDIDLQEDDNLEYIIKDITKLDLPLNSFTLGFTTLESGLAESIALYIDNSSSLKTLIIHDIKTNFDSLNTIVTSVNSKPSFKMFTIKGSMNQFDEDEEKIHKFIENNNKIKFFDY
jgi:hypothetical protein